jgi:chondroitin AC lyase
MVMLGAAITTGKAETVVNQAEWRDDVSFGSAAGTTRVLNSATEVNTPLKEGAWVYQDGVGYLMPPSSTSAVAKLTLERRKTRWSSLAKVNQTNPDAKQTVVPIFQLTIPQSGNNDTYAYAVLPHAKPAALAKYVTAPPFEILANTENAQAVRFNASGTIQAIFYKAGQITVGDASIAVDRPAVLMLTPQKDGWELLVSDPVQKTPAGQVTITTSLPIAGNDKSDNNNQAVIRCDLPDKPLIGKAAVVQLKKKN